MDPSIELRRQRALVDLEVLDAPADELFQRIVAMAASLTSRSMAAVSLSDAGRQFFLAELGLGVSEVAADVAFCRHAVGDADGLEVPDLSRDDRFRANPLVTQPAGIRTYAGVPLTMPDGLALGTLCVMDTVPGVLTEQQRATLRTLADVVSQLLQTRKVARDLATTSAERDMAHEQRQAALRDLQVMFDGVPAGLVLTDGDGIVRRSNPAIRALVGGGEGDHIGRPWVDLVADDDRNAEAAVLSDLIHGRRDTAVREVTLPRAQGAPGVVLASSSAARTSEGGVASIVTRIEDIAARRQAEIELRESQSALDGIITVNGDERIVSWNEGATRLLGHDRHAALGKDLSLIVPASAHEAHAHGFARLHGGGTPRLLNKTVELQALAADGSLLPVELSLSRWYRGTEPFYTAVIRDISERKRHEAELQWRTSHDPATGLANMAELRRWFDDQTAALPDGRLRAVFCLQLTNLSNVSAVLGSDGSAELLRQIGEAFTAAGTPEDLTVCHLRDTHFGGAVILEPDPHPARLEDRLRDVARYIVDAGTGPYLIDGTNIEMHLQLGIVATRRNALTFLELLREAEATRDGSARQINIADEIFTAASPAAARELAVLSDLREAIPHQQLELHYQPLSALQPGPVRRDESRSLSEPLLVEALVRWRHPVRGLVSPADFIPLVETSSMIFAFTEWVLSEALTQQRQWQARGLDVRVAVNVSPQVLLNDDVVSLVASALRTTGVAADRLKVEITESAIVDDPVQAQDVVVGLKQMGVHVSLDDFGTGYTSLRLLRDLAVDEIKLDRLFVANATSNAADAAIANAVGQLGQRLGISTVAEGIEEVETRSLFRAFGYDYMQGYLDSRPLTAADVETWLRQRHDVPPAAREVAPQIADGHPVELRSVTSSELTRPLPA